MTKGDVMARAKDAAHGLVYPFAALGLGLGWVADEAFALSDRSGRALVNGHVLLPLTTMLLCGWLGAIAAPRGALSWARLAVFIPVAGALNALFAFVNALPALLRGGTPLGFLVYAPIAGAFLSLPFAPPLALVARTFYGSVGRSARRGSIAALANARGACAAALTQVAIAAIVVTQLRGQRPPSALLTAGVPFLCGAGIGVLLGQQLAARARVRGWIALETRQRATGDAQPGRVDYGLGNEVYEEIAESPSPYRAGEAVVRVHYGNGWTTLQVLTDRITWASFAFLATLAAFGIGAVSATHAAAPAQAGPPPDPVERLYVSHPGRALVGLALHPKRAVVVGARDGSIETVDLEHGNAIEHRAFPGARSSTSSDAAGTAPRALTRLGRFEEYASDLRRAGPSWMRPADPNARVATSQNGDSFAYREPNVRDGPWRVVAAMGADDRGVPDLEPEDRPLFDPEGTTLVWAGRGEAKSTTDHLYIAHVTTSGPLTSVAIAGVDRVRAPVWSVDGAALFALYRSEERGVCLVTVPVHAPQATSVLLCRLWVDVGFELDPSGKHAVLFGRDPVHDVLHVVRMLVPDGTVTAETSIPKVLALTALRDETGLALGRTESQLAIVDIHSKCVQPLRGTQGARLPTHARWTDGTHLIADLDRMNGDVEVVAIDVSNLGPCAPPPPETERAYAR